LPGATVPKEDAGKLYDYIRPLATIEPTAIRFALPVDVSVGFDDREGLQAALEAHRAPDRNVLFLVAWEHRQIAPIIRALLAAHGAEAETINEGLGWQRLRQHLYRNDSPARRDYKGHFQSCV
jgi:hypothetical protein